MAMVTGVPVAMPSSKMYRSSLALSDDAVIVVMTAVAVAPVSVNSAVQIANAEILRPVVGSSNSRNGGFGDAEAGGRAFVCVSFFLPPPPTNARVTAHNNKTKNSGTRQKSQSRDRGE